MVTGHTVLPEPRTGSSHRGCGWIQVIQDRLFPPVRPILDYLFLEAADGSPLDRVGSQDRCMRFFLSWVKAGTTEPTSLVRR